LYGRYIFKYKYTSDIGYTVGASVERIRAVVVREKRAKMVVYNSSYRQHTGYSWNCLYFLYRKAKGYKSKCFL